ncbi:S-layer homology domain-containing protein [Bacillus benzoevorans]|uniref:SLH domain-containing protein n=1 Tax=Bacillus benzoevorans TaxID=1456 RepID=A0A7X0LTY4_9BACI|nr:S-layer homology domain-containing protein [Bacillus benzoevorans]MBB6444371.1 hypothetical protein [Bacillus benzoevorans]
MRRLLILTAIVLVLFLTAPMSGLAIGTFKDVSYNYTFLEEVEFLSSKKIISGYEDGTFKPYNSVTRGEAAIMIGRALELDGEPKNTKFRDVTSNVTGSGYIASAIEKGIITGYLDGTYRPYEKVTRGQMAILLNRAFRLTDSHPENKFIDISSNMSAYQSIINASALGIAKGFSDGSFRPEVILNRGEFSAFLARAIEPSLRVAETFAVESISGWEPGPSMEAVDIDHEWVIMFNDEVDWSNKSQYIYAVRERDNKRINLYIEKDGRKSLKFRLDKQFNFGETYSLFITKDVASTAGHSLAEPLQLKFQINQPDFNLKKIVEQDGMQFDFQLDQSNEKIFTKVTATNTTSETIPYIGFSSCDKGLNGALFIDTKDGPTTVGSQWMTIYGGCLTYLPQYQLQPGASIELMTVFYPPTEPVNGELYVKVIFQRGTSSNDYSYSPIEIFIPLEEFDGK